MGCVGVGATIYWGSDESSRQLQEVVARHSSSAHELGMFTVLWCYLRNNAFKIDGVDYHASADLTGQANHLGVTLEADIIKQKLPENNGGYTGDQVRQDPRQGLLAADDRPSDRPRPGTRSPTATWAASGSSTRAAHRARTTSHRPVATAVVNKRAGGMRADPRT